MKYYVRKRNGMWQFFWFMDKAKRPHEHTAPAHKMHSLEAALKMAWAYDRAAKLPEKPDMRKARAH